MVRRYVAITLQRALDLGVLTAAYAVAFLLRFEWTLPAQMLKRWLFTTPYVVALELATLAMFGVPRFAWRYIGLRESVTIVKALALATGVLLFVRGVGPTLMPMAGYGQYAVIPVGVIVVNFALAFLGITGIRALRRLWVERVAADKRRAVVPQQRVPTLLVGAGRAGLLVAKEISERPDLGIAAVGFIDDDANKVGSTVHGLRVLGTTSDIAAWRARTGAEQVLVTISDIDGKNMRRIVAACEQVGLRVKTVPGMSDIVGGKVNLSRIRDVAIEDLLRRPKVELDTGAIADFLERKTVVVTGAGGSIGSELCRQIASFGARRLVLIERYENALVDIHRELLALTPNLEIHACIADVTDETRMRRIFQAHRPDVVFHAAAHKHVPMMEQNPGEAIKNNVLGTRLVSQLAAECNVAHFVFVSTDKAVNPTSVMGASKRVSELLVQGMAQRSSTTRFVSVRFGNVMGSTGSVIPLFVKQIAHGGPVTVTHPDMERYFMTIPEAVQLVLQAATIGRGGEVLVLDMGEPVRIVDLARDLIRLSGFEPERDIKITYTGIRPGEKLFEELATTDELATRTKHQKIYVGKVQAASWDTLNRGVDALLSCTDRDDRYIYDALRRLIPEFDGGVSAKVIPLTPGGRQSHGDQ